MSDEQEPAADSAEPKLDIAPAQLARLVDRAPSGLIVVDDDGVVGYANATAVRMLGRGPLVGSRLGFPLSRRRTSLIEVRRPDGSTRETEMQTTRVRTAGRDSILVTLVAVTGRMDEARQMMGLDQRAGDVVAMASHELRTPLAATSAATRMLAERWDELPPIRRLSLLRRILEQTWRMDETITRVLDATSVDSGLVAPRDARSRIIDVILDGAPHLRDLVADLDVRVPEDVHAAADPAHVWTVVSNLLVNASKFAGGLVTIDAREIDGWCEISVTDVGPGVPEEQREAIFERYVRLPRDVDLEGLGLGLWIVREIAEAYGGSAHVDPSPRPPGAGGRAGDERTDDLPPGSRFVVRLPAPREAGPTLRLVTG